MRGTTVVIAAILAALPALVSLPAPAFSAEEGYVVGLGTYPLRAEPQFSSEGIDRLRVGEKVVIVEESSGWFRVRSGEKRGWMAGSVIGRTPPPAVELEPLRRRLSDTEEGLQRLDRENKDLKKENTALSEQVAVLEKDLGDSRNAAVNAKTYRHLGGIALGGGLVIFGWITGYLLAALSRRRSPKHKYRI